jgi:hypothetical protein
VWTLCPPFTRHSRTVPSWLHEASMPPFGAQASPKIHPLCPRRVNFTPPVSTSRIWMSF